MHRFINIAYRFRTHGLIFLFPLYIMYIGFPKFIFSFFDMSNAHLTGKTIIGFAHRTQEIVHIVIVNAPTRTVRCLAVESLVSGVVLCLCDRLREVLLINFRLNELGVNNNIIIANFIKTWVE